MLIVSEVKKAIRAHYLTTTLWTTNAYPLYEDHVPQSVTYPLITYYHISSNNRYAMTNNLTGHPKGYDYIWSRWQFSVFANDRQNMLLEDITDRVEDAYHKTPLILGNNCTHIATLVQNGHTLFYDQQQKIWSVHLQFWIWAGK